MAPDTAGRIENKRKAWESFVAGRFELDSFPFRAAIEITRNCNFRCVMCPQGERRSAPYDPGYDMPPELFSRIAGQLFPRLDYAHLQGFGETTFSRHWSEIFGICRNYAGKVRFGLITNLGVRDKAMWRRMIEADFHLNVSCDGVTSGTFERIRRGGSFTALLDNLSAVAAARKASGKGGFSMIVTLQKHNYREMPGFVAFAKRFGAERLTFTSVRTETRLGSKLKNGLSAGELRRGNVAPALQFLSSGIKRVLAEPFRVLRGFAAEDISLYRLPPEELSCVVKETLARATEVSMPLVFNDAYLTGLGAPEQGRTGINRPQTRLDWEEGVKTSSRVSVYQKCFKPWSHLSVNYRGEAGLCNHLISEEKWKQMGDLRASTLLEIWNSRRYIDLRRKLWTAAPDNEACLWCFRHRVAD